MNEKLKKELDRCWEGFRCACCFKKADLGCEIYLFPYCRNCYRIYHNIAHRVLKEKSAN